jgi:hypothetical protein
MTKRLKAGFALRVSVLILLSAPWLYSQQVDEKNPAGRTAPESEAVEKSRVHGAGGPCELTTCVTKIFYLSNLSQPTEMQDLMNALRTIAEISRIQQIPSRQLVIVRTTPEQLAMADKLADEIDKAKRFGGVAYRLDFKISESEGDKKLRSRVYSLVTEARDSAKLSIGRQVSAQSKTEMTSEDKQSPDTVTGRNIECRILAENERTIELHVDAAFSSSNTRQSGKDEKTGLNGLGSADPTQLRVKDQVLLELGKPTVIGMLDDPDSERAFQIEVTATRIKERQ